MSFPVTRESKKKTIESKLTLSNSRTMLCIITQLPTFHKKPTTILRIEAGPRTKRQWSCRQLLMIVMFKETLRTELSKQGGAGWRTRAFIRYRADFLLHSLATRKSTNNLVQYCIKATSSFHRPLLTLLTFSFLPTFPSLPFFLSFFFFCRPFCLSICRSIWYSLQSSSLQTVVSLRSDKTVL